MTSLTQSSSASTRSRSTNLIPRTASIIAVGGALSFLFAGNTSSTKIQQITEAPVAYVADATSSFFAGQTIRKTDDAANAPNTRHAITELRRLSGLTWEQLGSLFGVSRRSVHFWASGSPLTAANEKQLLEVLSVVRGRFEGDARSMRSALLSAEAGVSPFQLLASGRIAEARNQLGSSRVPKGLPNTKISPEARKERLNPSPYVLADALQDRVHSTSGKGRAVKTLRIKPG